MHLEENRRRQVKGCWKNPHKLLGWTLIQTAKQMLNNIKVNFFQTSPGEIH